MRNDRYNTYIAVHTPALIRRYVLGIATMRIIVANTNAATFGIERALRRVAHYEE